MKSPYEGAAVSATADSDMSASTDEASAPLPRQPGLLVHLRVLLRTEPGPLITILTGVLYLVVILASGCLPAA